MLVIKGDTLTDQTLYFIVSSGAHSLIDENTVANRPEDDFVYKQEGVKVKAGTPLFATSLIMDHIHVGALVGKVEISSPLISSRIPRVKPKYT